MNQNRSWSTRRGLPIETDLEKAPFSLYEGIEYAEFWLGAQKYCLDELEHILVRSLLPAAGSRIVDVGCGFGRLSDCYLDRFSQVVMVDGSLSLLRQSMERTNGRAVYIACDAMRLPFRKAAFDAVLMIRVFHHLRDSSACLHELNRVLCGGGNLVFNYLNKRNPRRVFRWLVGADTENPFTREPPNQPSTFISHHPGAIRALLRESSFSLDRCLGAGVLDRLAGRLLSPDLCVDLGKRCASFLGASGLASWMLCSASAVQNPALIPGGLEDILQCPACGGGLDSQTDSYLCRECQHAYPVEDGILDLRIH